MRVVEMGNIPTHEELTRLTETELIKQYNAAAKHTVVGTAFYLDELTRRKGDQQMVRMLSISRSVKHMTIAILILTFINVCLFAWTMFWPVSN
jgi:hypothetical protein